VLLGTNSGTWQGFEPAEVRQFPVPTPADPPPCPQEINGGFARVWAEQGGPDGPLGCSDSSESGLIEGAYQPFERGVMLYSKNGLGRGQTIYVLYNEGGAFERYDDPNQ
jgi:serine/threonine-protein kinase